MSTSTGNRIIGFPNPVDEVSARLVAGGVLLMGIAALATHNRVLLAVMAYGFVARVLTGPKLSPLGRFAMKVAAPRLGDPKYVPGPPKRFAQGVGVAFTTAALVAWLLGATTVTDVLLGLLIVASGLEAIFAVCLGCHVFAVLMRIGVIPDDVCEECNNIWARRAPA